VKRGGGYKAEFRDSRRWQRGAGVGGRQLNHRSRSRGAARPGGSGSGGMAEDPCGHGGPRGSSGHPHVG